MPRSQGDLSALTGEGQKTFQLAWTIRQGKDRKFNAQVDAIDKMSVSKYHLSISIACRPIATIKEQYNEPKEHAETGDTRAKADARGSYKLKPPMDFQAWPRTSRPS